MLWTPAYITSQIITVFAYILLIITFFMHNRKCILFFKIASCGLWIVSFLLLNAYSGMIMMVINTILFLLLLSDERQKKINIIKLMAFFCNIILISAIFTCDSVPSLLPILSTLIHTYSICQRNIVVYKVINIIVSVLWLVYNIYIWSVFSIGLESILLASTIAGSLIDLIKPRIKQKM